MNSEHTGFQGKRKVLKNPECQKYIQYSENFQGKLCFSGQAQVPQKSVVIKIYIQYSEFRPRSVFQGKCKLLKNPECQRYIQYSENFQDKHCFSGQE